MFDLWRRMRRADVVGAELPPSWRELMTRTVPLFPALPPADRDKLEALVRIFLAEKGFEGAGGLEMTDEMRVTIAARACLLVLKRVDLDDPLYPDLVTIVVYPRAYRTKSRRQDGAIVVQEDQVRLGESWSRGTVVLSWDAVRDGSARPRDGHDVVLHEFAHQLDAEDGGVDGAPDLGGFDRYSAWAKVFGEEYDALVRAVSRGKKALLNAYGATNPPEFFAVVTESFFERPGELRSQAPAVYRELSAFYRIDPARLLRSTTTKKKKR